MDGGFIFNETNVENDNDCEYFEKHETSTPTSIQLLKSTYNFYS